MADPAKFLTQWAANMVQTQQALDHAVQTFYLACDKELATAAGYRALGLDPTDAPKFGWLLSERPRVRVTTNTITDQSRKTGGWLRSFLTAAALLIGGAALGVSALDTLRRQPAPAARPPETDFRVRWWVEDGEVRTEVEKEDR